MLKQLLLFGAAATLPASAQKAAFAVAEKVAGEVGFYSIDGKRVGGTKVGKHPHEMALSPDGKLLYVTNNGMLWMTDPGEGGNTVSIVDVAARKTVGTIDLGKYFRPHGISFDPKSGRLLSTIENPDGLLLIDPAAKKVLRKYEVNGEDPHMVMHRPGAEWAYASNTGTGTLAAVHLESGRVKLIECGGRPQGGVFSHDGKTLYITNAESNTIAIFDVAKNERTGIIQTGKGPNRIALTPDGKTLVYSMSTAEGVGFADVASGKQTGEVHVGGRLLSLTLSPDATTAYTSAQEQDRIGMVSVPDRKFLRFIQLPKGSGPDPIVFLP